MIGGAKGIGIGIDFGIPNQYCRATSKPYIEKEVLDSLRVVASAYGKSNDDADRSIVKNLVDASNPFIISNAAFKLNSGFGEYKEDFTSWRIYPNIKVTDNVITTNGNFNSTWFIYKHSTESKINEMNIKVSGIPKGGKILYFYISDETANLPIGYTIPKDGIYHLPESKINNNRASVGFIVESSYDWNNIRIEQIPSFEGAFVTDGINDLITSTKTVSEMGVTNEITIISMIHQINLHPTTTSVTNDIRASSSDGSLSNGRNVISAEDKTGIYGWSRKDSTISVVNNILGDKNDYTAAGEVITNYNNKFSVVGTADNRYTSSVAWYWTVIANKVLTTDQINQVIAYFNLDRTLNPDILCNTIKQGITNENHAEFGDKLIDFSGNGRDIQLNNLAWKGGSGIAAKPFETIKDYTIVPDEAIQKLTIYNEFSYKIKSNTPRRYWTVQSIIRDNTSYQVTIITDKDCYWVNSTSFTNSEGNKDIIRREYLVKANTPTQVTICGLNEFEYPEGIEPTTAVSYINLSYAGEITVTFIPSYKGGLLLDGVNDFGKVTGMPVYKDYTVVADYIRTSAKENAADSSILSKSKVINNGAFLFNYLNVSSTLNSYSFGTNNMLASISDSERKIYYQSKYVNEGKSINSGTGTDYDSMWLGTYRDNVQIFFNGAIYSLMSFPYSMSEFLIERQLKKHKLGTLYPNMVEFRPVIKANANYKITYYQIDSTNTWKPIKVGDYIVIGAKLAFQITFDNDASELKEVVSPQLSGIIVKKRPSNPGYNIYSYITSKSPQKINITIDEYIRFEDIVQPYPVIFQITDRNTNQRYSWGDKIKVGSSIQLSQGEKPNLLSGLYSIQSYEYEGKTYSYNQLTNLNIILTKQSISLSCNKIWLLDDNEPKCILSPRLLRIPNSSYKILGHIPDISGHGNNGKINNSAYAEGSGVNEDGSYQFDGVDDFVTIPTLSSGGKQMLMKVNWNSLNQVLYDQRNNAEAPFCIVTASGSIAYNQRNVGGNTYIDGILNNHILADDLQAITHNIVLNNDYNVANSNSFIGTNYTKSIYAKMSLYDFMLFDNISTDDKIKELNKYVGIEGDVWGILTQLSNSTLISNETLIKNE